MARFLGTAGEFKQYFGPRVRNQVQYFTRKYKEQVGACEHCGATKRLQAAHIRGHERNVLINKVLRVDSDDATVDVDLPSFEEAFLAGHQPLEKTIKILCISCHRQYDNGPASTGGQQVTAPQTSPHPSSGGVLPITLDPASAVEFKRRLLQTRRAQISMHYLSGRVEPKVWRAEQFRESSNVMGNLRSRPEFRKGAWKDAGIERVHVRVVEVD